MRELYANIITGVQTFSMVRGVNVSFSASSVNMHRGLSDCADTFRAFVDNVGSDDLRIILREIAVEGTE